MQCLVLKHTRNRAAAQEMYEGKNCESMKTHKQISDIKIRNVGDCPRAIGLYCRTVNRALSVFLLPSLSQCLWHCFGELDVCRALHYQVSPMAVLTIFCVFLS